MDVGYEGWKSTSSWVRRPGCEMSNPHGCESNPERNSSEKEDSKPELKSSGNKRVTRKGGQEKTV